MTGNTPETLSAGKVGKVGKESAALSVEGEDANFVESARKTIMNGDDENEDLTSDPGEEPVETLPNRKAMRPERTKGRRPKGREHRKSHRKHKRSE